MAEQARRKQSKVNRPRNQRPIPDSKGKPDGPGVLLCPMCGSRVLGDVGHRDGYRYLGCERCELVFTPYPEQEAERIYEARDEHHGEPPAGGWAWPNFLEPAFRRLALGRPLRILDFGCGESALPDWLRERSHRVIGVDLAPPYRPHPDRLTGDLLDLGLEPDRFDLAYAFQVFEHLPRPRPLLEELLRLTRPGGCVLIHTDMEVPEREDGVERWWYAQPPTHCTLYRHRSFEIALNGRPHRIADRGAKHVLIEAGREHSSP